MVINKLQKVLNDSAYRFAVLRKWGVYDHLDDEKFLKTAYKAYFKRELDLEYPKTFNEKLQWLKLHDRNPSYTDLVDKYAVKEYIASRIGEEYIIPTLGVWDHFDEIDFDKLPHQFVLKCTHDSGGLVIVKDKSKLDKEAAKKKIEKSLKRNYFFYGREWPYKNVPPRIIAEKFMVDDSGEGLRDYKVLCFEGEPKLIEYHLGRFTSERYQDFYDTAWNKLKIEQVGEKISPIVEDRPAFLDEMLTLSRTLSKDIHHVRVDWYFTGGQLYFGELTFYDASGFDPFKDENDDLMLGSWINI